VCEKKPFLVQHCQFRKKVTANTKSDEHNREQAQHDSGMQFDVTIIVSSSNNILTLTLALRHMARSNLFFLLRNICYLNSDSDLSCANKFQSELAGAI
jgi:hypothetical protein